MFNLTENELAVVKALAFNNYSIGYCDDLEGATWSEFINDSAAPSGIEGRSLSGVVSSLCQKGLIASSEYDRNEWTISWTEAGRAFVRQNVPNV
jgi:DNA-binding MarR family transcriptional regulator